MIDLKNYDKDDVKMIADMVIDIALCLIDYPIAFDAEKTEADFIKTVDGEVENYLIAEINKRKERQERFNKIKRLLNERNKNSGSN